VHGPKIQPLAFLGLKAMLGEKSKMVSLADSSRKKAFAYFYFYFNLMDDMTFLCNFLPSPEQH
jgi:hypothetical protein